MHATNAVTDHMSAWIGQGACTQNTRIHALKTRIHSTFYMSEYQKHSLSKAVICHSWFFSGSPFQRMECRSGSYQPLSINVLQCPSPTNFRNYNRVPKDISTARRCYIRQKILNHWISRHDRNILSCLKILPLQWLVLLTDNQRKKGRQSN